MLGWVRGLARWLSGHLDELSLLAIGMMFFLVASNTQTGWIYLMSATLFGALLTAFVSSRRALRPRGVQLLLPTAVEQEQLFIATLSWEEMSQGYPTFCWTDQPGPLEVQQQGRNNVMLPPGAGEAPVWLRPARRGVYPELGARLVCYGPLAWFAAQRHVAVKLNRPLVVLPRLLPVSAQELMRGSGAQLVAERRGPRLGQGDLRRLREYQVGDDVRSIHWASSARAGHLVVRELSQGGSSHLQLVWGCGPEALKEEHSEAAFEWLLSWVYSYFRRASQSGWQVTLWAPGPQGYRPFSEPGVLAQAAPVAASAPDELPQAGRRIDFWLGAYRGANPEFFEFHPADHGPDGSAPVAAPRVAAGQEPG